MNHDRALQTRAAAARHAIRYLHVDPLLALSYVVWPTPRIARTR